MARAPVADVEIDNHPYVLLRPPQLGFASKEPAAAGSVGTIEIPSFHLGPGEFVARTLGRFLESRYMEAGTPGQLGRVGAPSTFAYTEWEGSGTEPAPVFGAVTSTSGSNVSSLTFSHTVGAGSGRLLLVH